MQSSGRNQGGTNDFISLLMLYRKHNAADIETAVELALEDSVRSSESIRHLLIYANGVESVTKALDDWDSIPPTDIGKYGQLGGVQ